MSNIDDNDYNQCLKQRTHPIISVNERKRKFVINNPNKKEVHQVTVDGCLPIKGIKCDYLFEVVDSKTVYYVELKGKDVKHALEQLLATLSNSFIKSKHVGYKKRCVVVSSRVPQMDPSVQRLQKQCRKQIKAILAIKNQRCEVKI